jgi:hypothetical protein
MERLLRNLEGLGGKTRGHCGDKGRYVSRKRKLAVLRV